MSNETESGTNPTTFEIVSPRAAIAAAITLLTLPAYFAVTAVVGPDHLPLWGGALVFLRGLLLSALIGYLWVWTDHRFGGPSYSNPVIDAHNSPAPDDGKPRTRVYVSPGLLGPDENSITNFVRNALDDALGSERANHYDIFVIDHGREGYNPHRSAFQILEDFHKNATPYTRMLLLTLGSGDQITKCIIDIASSSTHDLRIDSFENRFSALTIDPYLNSKGIAFWYLRLAAKLAAGALAFAGVFMSLTKAWTNPVFAYDGHDRSLAELKDLAAAIASGDNEYEYRHDKQWSERLCSLFYCVEDDDIFYAGNAGDDKYDDSGRSWTRIKSFNHYIYPQHLANVGGSLCNFKDPTTYAGYVKALRVMNELDLLL